MTDIFWVFFNKIAGLNFFVGLIRSIAFQWPTVISHHIDIPPTLISCFRRFVVLIESSPLIFTEFIKKKSIYVPKRFILTLNSNFLYLSNKSATIYKKLEYLYFQKKFLIQKLLHRSLWIWFIAQRKSYP